MTRLFFRVLASTLLGVAIWKASGQMLWPWVGVGAMGGLIMLSQEGLGEKDPDAALGVTNIVLVMGGYALTLHGVQAPQLIGAASLGVGAFLSGWDNWADIDGYYFNFQTGWGQRTRHLERDRDQATIRALRQWHALAGLLLAPCCMVVLIQYRWYAAIQVTGLLAWWMHLPGMLNRFPQEARFPSPLRLAPTLLWVACWGVAFTPMVDGRLGWAACCLLLLVLVVPLQVFLLSNRANRGQGLSWDYVGRCCFIGLTAVAMLACLWATWRGYSLPKTMACSALATLLAFISVARLPKDPLPEGFQRRNRHEHARLVEKPPLPEEPQQESVTAEDLPPEPPSQDWRFSDDL